MDPVTDQSDLRAQLAEASSEDSDLETDEETPRGLPKYVPTTTDTIYSNISGTSGTQREPSFPLLKPSPQPEVNKRRFCLLLFTHSLAFILGLYIGGKLLMNRRVM